MEFYDNVKQTAAAAGEKVSQIADLAKVKIEIVDVKQSLKKLYENLGKAVYNGASEDEISSVCEKLDAKKGELERLQHKLACLKGEQTCSDCGKKNNKDAKYCDSCGSRL